jgi:hypothetical protein
MHDGVQHGLPLLVRRLLRLLLLLLLLRRHLLPALQMPTKAWSMCTRISYRRRACRRRSPCTYAQPDLSSPAVLAHQLLHAALPDCLQLRVICLRNHPVMLDYGAFSRKDAGRHLAGCWWCSDTDVVAA